jgi:hypothetical protein
LAQLWHASVIASTDNDYVVDPIAANGQPEDCVYVVGFVLTFDSYAKAGETVAWRLVSAARGEPEPIGKVLAHFQGLAAATNPISYTGSIAEPALVTETGEALRANFQSPGLLSGFVVFYLAPWDVSIAASV